MKVDVGTSKLSWLQNYCNKIWKMLHAKRGCAHLYLSNFYLIALKELFVHFYFLCYVSLPKKQNYHFKLPPYTRAIYAIEVQSQHNQRKRQSKGRVGGKQHHKSLFSFVYLQLLQKTKQDRNRPHISVAFQTNPKTKCIPDVYPEMLHRERPTSGTQLGQVPTQHSSPLRGKQLQTSKYILNYGKIRSALGKNCRRDAQRDFKRRFLCSQLHFSGYVPCQPRRC